MKKSLLELYGLAVCFICMLFLTFSMGTIINEIVKFIYPKYAVSTWDFEKYQSNDVFCSSKISFNTKTDEPCKNLSDAAITKKRETAYNLAIQNGKQVAIYELIFALIMMAVNLLIFIPHWIIAKNARNANGDCNGNYRKDQASA